MEHSIKYLTVPQAAAMLNYKESYLRKLLMAKNRRIPVYQPGGEHSRVYLRESDILDYLAKGRCSTQAEIEQQAADYCREKAQ